MQLQMETKHANGGKQVLHEKAVWIPPPGLTSNLWKKLNKTKKYKSYLASAKSGDGMGNKDSNFEIHLKELLREIEQLKSEISFEEDESGISHQKKKLKEDVETVKPFEDTIKKVLEPLEKTIKKAVEDLKCISEKEDVYQANLNLKTALDKSSLENERLTQQQNVLNAKLKQVERNAVDAIQHIMALRHFITQFNANKQTNKEKFDHSMIKDMFSKLKQLDQANISLNHLISSSKNGVDTKENLNNKTEMPTHEDQVFPDSNVAILNQKIINLESELKNDKAQIAKLQAAVNDANQTVNEEKESLIKLIMCHKQRANRYLTLMETLKTRLSHKNFEMSGLISEVSSLKLQIARLISERDRLKIENATLSEKVVVLSPKTKSQSGVSPQPEEKSLTSNYLSKIDVLQVENEKLKSLVSSVEEELRQCRTEMQRQNEEIQKLKSSSIVDNDRYVKLHKSIQTVEDVGNLSDPSHKVGSVKNRKSPGQHHLQITEVWKQLQSEKLNILQTLKELEQKLQKSQDANLDFRKELSQKDDLMNEINTKLQEKIEENNSLKQLLESALSDARKHSEQAKESSLSIGQIMQSKLVDLERHLQEFKTENTHLRLIHSETERKLNLQVKELQDRLKLAEKSKKNMSDYIALLKSSYANVFGDDSLAIKNYAL